METPFLHGKFDRLTKCFFTTSISCAWNPSCPVEWRTYLSGMGQSPPFTSLFYGNWYAVQSFKISSGPYKSRAPSTCLWIGIMKPPGHIDLGDKCQQRPLGIWYPRIVCVNVRFIKRELNEQIFLCRLSIWKYGVMQYDIRWKISDIHVKSKKTLEKLRANKSIWIRW